MGRGASFPSSSAAAAAAHDQDVERGGAGVAYLRSGDCPTRDTRRAPPARPTSPPLPRFSSARAVRWRSPARCSVDLGKRRGVSFFIGGGHRPRPSRGKGRCGRRLPPLWRPSCADHEERRPLFRIQPGGLRLRLLHIRSTDAVLAAPTSHRGWTARGSRAHRPLFLSLHFKGRSPACARRWGRTLNDGAAAFPSRRMPYFF